MKNQKILILEDSPYRIENFRKMLSEDNILFISSDVESCKLMYNEVAPFDMIFLDHDLGGETFVDSNADNTGYQFCRFLENKGVNDKVIIHSMNPGGAQKMRSVLPGAKILPYRILVDFIKNGYFN